MFCTFKTVYNMVKNVSFRPQLTITPLTSILSRSYAEPGKKGKLTVGVKNQKIPVERDPHKLVNYCCGSNIYKEGEDVELKPESEYPEWLWSIRTGPAPKLEELDPSTKAYWLKVRVLARRKKNQLIRLKYKVIKKF